MIWKGFSITTLPISKDAQVREVCCSEGRMGGELCMICCWLRMNIVRVVIETMNGVSLRCRRYEEWDMMSGRL